MTFQNLTSTAQKLVADNSPLILTGIGVAGVLTTAVLTGKATVKATRLIDRHPYVEMGGGTARPIDNREKFTLVWQLYIPATITGIVTVGAVIASHQIGARRTAAMAGAYVLSSEAFKEYREKVSETMGKKKERAVQDAVVQDRLNSHPVGEIITTGKGSTLCLEPFSMRYFHSSRDDLMWAQNSLNHTVINHQYASLTDFYNLIGLDRTQMSDDLGWNSDELLELTFTSGLTDKGLPCLVMNYEVIPGRNYDKVH